MNENQGILKMYNEEEIKQLLNSNERLVYIDDGTDEIEQGMKIYQILL